MRHGASAGSGKCPEARAGLRGLRAASRAKDRDSVICLASMRKLFLYISLVPCVALLVACPKKKEDGADAADEASVAVADAAPAPPAAPVAKNAPDVARFPAEKLVTDDATKTIDGVEAKTGPKSGNNVAFVKAGTQPYKIADFSDCFLVTFPDPKDANVTLMGWIPKTAFTVVAQRFDAGAKDAAVDAAVAVPVIGAIKCPAGQETVINVVGAAGVCRKKCTADKDCKNPAPGSCQAATTSVQKITKVCVSEAP